MSYWNGIREKDTRKYHNASGLEISMCFWNYGHGEGPQCDTCVYFHAPDDNDRNCRDCIERGGEEVEEDNRRLRRENEDLRRALGVRNRNR